MAMAPPSLSISWSSKASNSSSRISPSDSTRSHPHW
uniref:Uncharacterized protein n=1 Tax=Arundo donax TaxID=35708 RepID=A0A0A8ZBR4_ARUDO